MEHRCGTRVPMWMRVRLDMPSQVLAGRILNLSLSGAFVAIPERLPEQARLVVEVAAQGGLDPMPRWRVPAHIVRTSDAGLGLEWDVFAPWPILTLLRRTASGAPRSFSSGKIPMETRYA